MPRMLIFGVAPFLCLLDSAGAVSWAALSTARRPSAPTTGGASASSFPVASGHISSLLSVSHFTEAAYAAVSDLGQNATSGAKPIPHAALDWLRKAERFVNEVRTPANVPGGHTKAWLNGTFCLVLVSLAAIVAGSWALEPMLPKQQAGRPPPAVAGLFVASYVLLALGVTQILFALRVAISIMGLHIGITRSPDGSPASITESLFAVISQLWSTGNYPGALLLITYGIVIPLIKLLLLVLAEKWRFDNSQMARNCICFVQSISKWACPDVFAYVLLLYLFRDLGHRSGVIEAPVQLDFGFMCFSLFCIVSTLASLWIPLPGMSERVAERIRSSPPLVIRWFGEQNLVLVVGAMACGFFTLLGIGLRVPCMGLHIDTGVLIEPRGPLPAKVGDAISVLHLADNLASDVSLWSCCKRLFFWIAEDGEANNLTGFLMLAGFAILLSLVDVTLLVANAHRLRIKAAREGPTALDWVPGASHVVNHVCMLDVCMMGVFVVCMASKVYEKQGVVLQARLGLAWLLAAELVHYAAYNSVAGAVQYCKVKQGVSGR